MKNASTRFVLTAFALAFSVPASLALPAKISDQTAEIPTETLSSKSTEQLRTEARELSHRFKFREAQPIVDELIRREPKNAKFRRLDAMGLIEQGRFQKALDEFAEAYRLEPTNTSSRFKIAQIYVYQGRFKDAATILEGLKRQGGFMSRDARKADAALSSIAAYYEMGDPHSKSYANGEEEMLWSKSDFPIKVAIWSDPEMRELKEPFRKAVIESFTKWRDAAGGWLRFQIVDDQRKAKIVCKLVNIVRGTNDQGGDNGKLGETLGDCDTKNGDVRGFSRVEVFWGPNSNPAHFNKTVLHEVGHSLGLSHSNNPMDVMYPVILPPYSNYPTARDSASLKALYGIK